MLNRIWRQRVLAGAAAGYLFVSGCLAALERNIDLVYATEATPNLLVLPWSGLLGVAEFFARWVRE